MGDVIDIESAREVWTAGACGCGACGTLWIGVVHEDCEFGLECPHCGGCFGVLVVDLEVIDSDVVEEWLSGARWLSHKDPIKHGVDG